MSDMKAVLVQTRKTLSDPQSWTRGCLARSERGKPVDCDSALARSFCLLGAIEGADSQKRLPLYYSCDILMLLGFKSTEAMVRWNDKRGRTHAEVLARLDKAIEAAS